MLRYVVGLVALLTIFSSCSTDIKLTGEYQETPLIYGLLDPNDNPSASLNPTGVAGSGHVFRIQKAFLGEESAFIMALEPDSSYFKYENLFVELIEYNGSSETNRWELDTVMINNKDTGNSEDGIVDFFGPSQRLYKTKTTSGSGQVNISAARTYEVTLKKRPIGLIGDMTIANMADVEPIADATTAIVNTSTFTWNTPNENSPAIPGTTRKMDLFGTSGQFKDYTIRFSTAEQAKQYEVWLRFYYREVRDGIETEKSLEWKVTTFELESGVADWQVQMLAASIYGRIGSEFSPEANVIRYIGLAENSPNDPFPGDGQSYDFDIFIRMAGDDLFQFIDINNPNNSGALQDKPVYTNVNNGLGVFSSRSEVEFRGLYLSVSAGQQLVDGTYTSGLGFIDD
ncbi:MAG: hypothetical protein K9J17_17070 [Flavobacteriales bacterium]|nr:hypothetical protein [Flavobacteriales bacterium]